MGRKRNKQPTKTVLQAFTKAYGNDLEAFESMLLSLEDGTGVEVERGQLRNFSFYPMNEYGAYLYAKRKAKKK